jgi:thiol-disulfide isomerase/thioredoxin
MSWVLNVLAIAVYLALAQQTGTPGATSPFSDVSPRQERPLQFITSLPEFHATDLAGKHWSTSNLHGKITFIDIWATFCIPCRAEHPEIQRFYDKVQNSPDIQVLTFAIDADPSVVERYLREKKFTFPVIVDPELAESLFTRDGGVPKQWVVDRAGRRTERFEDYHIGHLLYEVERLAKSSQ